MGLSCSAGLKRSILEGRTGAQSHMQGWFLGCPDNSQGESVWRQRVEKGRKQRPGRVTLMLVTYICPPVEGELSDCRLLRDNERTGARKKGREAVSLRIKLSHKPCMRLY